MKIFKLLSLSLVIILSSCTSPGSPALPVKTASQSLSTPIATMTLQINPTATYIAPTATASPISTPLPPNTPVLTAYNYICELAEGGGNMTMYLTWADRSDGEEGYKVYRDGQVVATLAPNSTFYADMAFVADGKTLSYSVEAFNKDWQVSTTTITNGCQ